MNKDQFIDEIRAADNSFILELRIGMSWNVEKFYRLAYLFHEYIQLQNGKAELNRDVVAGVFTIHETMKNFMNRPLYEKPEPIRYYHECLQIFEALVFHYCNDTPLMENVEGMIASIKTSWKR